MGGSSGGEFNSGRESGRRTERAHRERPFVQAPKRRDGTYLKENYIESRAAHQDGGQHDYRSYPDQAEDLDGNREFNLGRTGQAPRRENRRYSEENSREVRTHSKKLHHQGEGNFRNDSPPSQSYITNQESRPSSGASRSRVEDTSPPSTKLRGQSATNLYNQTRHAREDNKRGR